MSWRGWLLILVADTAPLCMAHCLHWHQLIVLFNTSLPSCISIQRFSYDGLPQASLILVIVSGGSVLSYQLTNVQSALNLHNFRHFIHVKACVWNVQISTSNNKCLCRWSTLTSPPRRHTIRLLSPVSSFPSGSSVFCNNVGTALLSFLLAIVSSFSEITENKIGPTQYMLT